MLFAISQNIKMQRIQHLNLQKYLKLVGNSSRELTDIEGIFNIDNGVINISDGRSVNELYTLANELSGGGDILKGMAILADYLYEGYKLVDDAMMVSGGDPYIFTGALAVEAILTILNKSTGDTEPGYPGGAIMYEELGFQKRRDIKYVTTIAQILYIESNPMYRYLIDAKASHRSSFIYELMDRKDKINTLSTKSMKEKFPYLSNYSEVTTENILFMGNLQLNEIINVNQNVEKYKKMMNKDLKKIKEMVKSEYDK